MREREVERHAPAERVADERRALDPELVEERAHVLDVGEGDAGERRVAEAAQIGPDDAMLLGELIHEPVPEPPVAHAGVEEDERRAVTGRVVRELGAVDAGEGQWCSCAWESR